MFDQIDITGSEASAVYINGLFSALANLAEQHKAPDAQALAKAAAKTVGEHVEAFKGPETNWAAAHAQAVEIANLADGIDIFAITRFDEAGTDDVTSLTAVIVYLTTVYAKAVAARLDAAEAA